ncbi:MAG: hypothetical protein HYS05_04400 [Acidobacteria bacterium]|nr:hypothetical protein [Acidobacteriota bacterium]
MRKFYAVLAAVAILVAFSSPAVLAQKDAKETTISGKLIDGACYTKLGKDKAVADGHNNCNMKCAKSGSPLAIFTTKEEIYTVTGDYTKDNNAKLLDFVSKQVEAKGHVMTDKDGKKELHLMSIKEVDTKP